MGFAKPVAICLLCAAAHLSSRGADGAGFVYFDGNGGLVNGVRVYTNAVHLSDLVETGGIRRYRCGLPQDVEPPAGMHLAGWFATPDGESSLRYDTMPQPHAYAAGSIVYAHWARNVFTVTFLPNGGTGSMEDQTVFEGDELTLAGCGFLAPAGKTFLGWLDDRGEMLKDGETYRPAGNSTLTAQWRELVCTVVFAENAGRDAAVTNAEMTLSSKLPRNPFKRSGYSFGGWTLDKDGSGTVYADNSGFDAVLAATGYGDIVLYAQWTANGYAAVYKAGGGNASTGSVDVVYASPYGKLETPVRDGYAFGGWFLDDGVFASQVVSSTIVTNAANHNLYAKWTPVDVVVKFDANGGYVPLPAKTVEFGAEYGDLPRAQRIGHAQTGWFDSADGGNRIASTNMVSMSSPRVLYAHWSVNRYSIVCRSANRETKRFNVDYGAAYADLDDPADRDGYVFIGWFTEADGGEPVGREDIHDEDGNRVLYAHWGSVVTLDPLGGEVEPSTIVIPDGGKFGLLPVPVRDGYLFAGWYTAKTGGNLVRYDTVKESPAPLALYARWTAMPVVVGFDAGEGGRAVPAAKEVVFDGKYGDLPVPVREGYAFVRWSNDFGDDVNRLTMVTIPSNHWLRAVWTEQSYEVSFDSNGGNEQDSMTIEYGKSSGDLPTPSKVGCRFAGWRDQDGNSVDGVVVSNAANVVLYASWEPITYPVRFSPGSGSGTMKEQTFYYGIEQPLSSNGFSNAGCAFAGWSTNSASVVDYLDGDIFVSKALDGTSYNLTAVWTSLTYRVTYVAGTVVKSEDLQYGGKYGDMPSPDPREHYDFAGWYTSLVGGSLVTSNSIVSADKDHSLYAHWKAKDGGFEDVIGDERIYCESRGDNGAPKWYVNGGMITAPDDYPDNTEPAQLKLVFDSDCGGTLSFRWMLEHDDPQSELQIFTVDGLAGPLKTSGTSFNPKLVLDPDNDPQYGIWYETNVVVEAGNTDITFKFSSGNDKWDFSEFSGNIRANVSNIVFREWERVDLPAAKTGLVFNGLSQTGVVEGVGFTLTGNVQSNAGEHVAIASLVAGKAWNGIGGTDEKEIGWRIEPEPVDVAAAVLFEDVVFTYDGRTKTNKFEIPSSLTGKYGTINVAYDYYSIDTPGGGMTNVGSAGVSEIGEYVVIASLSFAESTQNYRLSDTELSARLTILETPGEIPRPVARTGLAYNGMSIEGVPGGFGYSVTGNTATNAGDYVATARLDDGFVWAGGSSEVLYIPWSIAKTRYDMSGMVAGDAVFDYDGTAKSLSIAGLPDGVVASFGGNGRCEAGLYAVAVEFFGDWTNYEYVAPTNFTLTVNPVPAVPDSHIPIAVPAPVAGLLYDGLCKTGVVESAGFTLSGNVATNAGEYVATARLSDGCKWSDGSAEDTQIKWSIARAEHDISDVGGLGYFAYDGTDKIFSLTNLPDGVVAVYSGNIQSEPGIHEVKVDFIVDEINYLTIAAKTYTLEISEEVEKPEAVPGGFVYSGGAVTGVVGSAGFTLTGNVATNAGEYVAVAKLKNGYRWADGSLGDEEIPWTIAKAVYDMGGVLFPDGEYGFDGEPKSLAVEGPLPAGVAVSYSGNGQTEPGVYEIEAAFSGDGANYEPIPPMKAKLTIVAADPPPEGELFPAEESLGEFDASQAFTYNGWLKDADGKIAGAITVKTGKAKAGKNSKVTISYTLLGGKKTTVRTEIAPGGKPVDESGIVYGALGLSGSFKGYTVEAAKDLTKSKIAAEKALADKYPAGVWTFAFDTGSGYAGFSATLAKKGKAKISGYLPDGTKISVSAQGALGETAFAVPCAYSKKNVSFGFVLWLPLDGTPASVVDVSADGWECEKGAAHMTLADGTLRLLMEIPAFREYIGELDGFDLLPSTFTVRNGKILREKTVGKVKAKDGDPYVDYRAGQTPANLPALKLACAAKTGLVSGSFKLYYLSGGRLKTDTVTVRGVMSGGEFFGSGAVKKQGAFAIAGE